MGKGSVNAALRCYLRVDSQRVCSYQCWSRQTSWPDLSRKTLLQGGGAAGEDGAAGTATGTLGGRVLATVLDDSASTKGRASGADKGAAEEAAAGDVAPAGVLGETTWPVTTSYIYF